MTDKKEVKAPKLNAKQKIEAIEDRLSGMDSQFMILAEEIDKIATVVQQVVRRLTAVVKATESETGVQKIMLDNSIEELKDRVSFLIDQGALIKDDKRLINDMTFLVCREVDNESNVINPRIQFAILSLADDAVKAPFLGKKLGDIVTTEDGVKLEVTEVYGMYEIKQNKNFEDEVIENSSADIAPLEEELNKATKVAKELKEVTEELKDVVKETIKD